jgi:hypothetical protein
MYGGEVHVKVLMGNSKHQRPFGRPTLGWEDNIKVLEGVKWINVVEVRDRPAVSPCEHSNEPLHSIKGGKLLV